MTFAYRVIADPAVDRADEALKKLLIKDAEYAVGQWSNVLQGQGELVVKVELSTKSIIRAGGIINAVDTGTKHTFNVNGVNTTKNVAITSVDSVLLNGTHNNTYGELAGTGADVIIRFDPTFLTQKLFLDPTPETNNDIPFSKWDAISVMEHEFAHALGMQGFFPRDADNIVDLGGFASGFDRWITFGSNGTPSFIGPKAVAAHNGQAVVLTDLPDGVPGSEENTYHLAGIGNDLMNGQGFPNGFRITISPLDVAVVKDASGLGSSQPNPFTDPAFNVRPGIGDTLPPLKAVNPPPTLRFPSMPETTMAMGDMTMVHQSLVSCET